MSILNRASIVSIFIFCFISIACERDNTHPVESYLISVEKNHYYDQEIIPSEYQPVYGIWKLFGITGGFLGGGYDTDFDYLEIKNYGIYGLVRGDSVFEFGKIELASFDNITTDALQVEFIADYYSERNPYMTSIFYLYIDRQDTLDMNTGCANSILAFHVLCTM